MFMRKKENLYTHKATLHTQLIVKMQYFSIRKWVWLYTTEIIGLELESVTVDANATI